MMKGFLNAFKSSLDIDMDGNDKIDIRDVMELRVRLIYDNSAFIRLPSRVCERLLGKAPKFPLPMKVKVIERGANTSRNNTGGGVPYDIPAHEKEKVFSVIKYVSWAGSTSELGGQIFMDVPVAAAKCLGLEDGDLCRVWPVFFAPIASAVYVSPMQKDDWDVVFAQSDRVEESLLKQLGSAYEGMKFAFFPSVKAGGKPIVLKCTKVEAYVENSENNSKNSQVFPSVVRLAPNTELIVAPPAKEDKKSSEEDTLQSDDDEEEEKMKSFCARVQRPTYHILDELTVKINRDFKATNDAIINDFNCELSGIALLRVSKDKNEQVLPCREGRLCRVRIYSEERKFRNERSALVQIKYSSHVHLRPGHVALPKSIMDFMGIVQGDTVVLSKGPKPLKVDDFAQVVIQLRPSIVKEEEKKFKLHEGDETSSEEEEDDDYGFESDDSEDIKAKNSIFNDTGLLPKSKPLTPTQILATKLTGPQRIALGLGNLNVFATEDSDYQYDSEDEYEETLADLRLVTPESCNSGAKRVLLDWLDAHVRNAGSGACGDIGNSRNGFGNGNDRVLEKRKKNGIHLSSDSKITFSSDEIGSGGYLPFASFEVTISVIGGKAIHLSDDAIPLIFISRDDLVKEDSHVKVELGETTIYLDPRKEHVNLLEPCLGVSVMPSYGQYKHLGDVAPGERYKEAAIEVMKRVRVSLWEEAQMMRNEEKCFQIPGGSMLCGKHYGSHRDPLAKGIAWNIANDPNCYASVVEVKCKDLPKHPRKAIKALRHALKAAHLRAPAICLLLDLDAVCKKQPEGAEDAGEMDDAYHIAALLADEIKYCVNMETVCFLATVEAKENVAKPLLDEEVFYMFQDIGPMDDDARKESLMLISAGLNFSTSADVAEDIAQDRKTIGYDLRDLELLVSGAIKYAFKRLKLHEDPEFQKRQYGGDHDFIPLALEDYEKAREGIKPSGDEGLNLTDPSVYTIEGGLSAIGGYEGVKQSLNDCILLPGQFPEIFAQCPLRLKTNVLLYGPPGVGKTFIAHAAISESGMRCIKVRGPEIMSKFIGESEKAIREIFKRARSAAPCCLFFDEFDSICPRRGSDNAGVMDRLVNQLLTEIDGFEELRGVYVIATSSRPDTIDPALLRPGRLDNLLFLDWPTEKERYDIMWKLTRDIKTDPDVNLCAIAAKEMPHGTTGADIKGLLNECSVNAATRVINAHEEALKIDDSLPDPTEVPSISSEDVRLARKTGFTRMRDVDRKELAIVYENFHRTRSKSLKDKKDNFIDEKDLKQTFAS
tara:strand:- start:3681 stop:7508 length:3828 start_codon:yes stop_codon:yes gene_type:complete